MIENIFNPKSVAIIGASANPNKWGNWAAEQAIWDQQYRNVWLVNEAGEEIYGRKSYRKISDLPGSIDVAIVVVPLFSFERTVDELLAHGTKVIVGITTGFGEKNQRGFDLEMRVLNKIHEAGSILVGPNCAGILDYHSHFRVMPVLCPEKHREPGTVGLISQSGGMITDIYLRLEEVGLNFSRAISTGNMYGLQLSELVENFDNDPNTSVIALYLERATVIPRSKKPLVLLSASPTPTAQIAAKHHTNSSLISYDNNTFTVREFVAVIQAAASNQKGVGKRIAIATDSGGMGILAASECEQWALQPQAPIDMVGIPSGFYPGTVELMTQLQADPDVDAIMMILFLIEAELPEEAEVALKLAEAAREGGKPVVFVCKKLDAPGAQALLKSNMPVYRDVDIAVKALEFLCG